MADREMALPKQGEPKQEDIQEQTVETKETNKEEVLTKEEAELREKVFFEDDEEVRLRDGKTYKIPPLSLKDARILIKKLKSVDTSVIIANFLEEDGKDRYDDLLEVLLLAFKPYYKDMTVEYLAEYVDLEVAKEIIDIMIGLNGLKKSL